jgi:hypothetical protein
MNRQVFRNNDCHRDQGDTQCLDSRLANLNVSSLDTSDGSKISLKHLSPIARYSFEHIVSNPSRSFDIEEREDFEVPVIQKLSISFSQEYPFRDVTDSREPEEEKYCESRGDNDERTATSPRSSQDIFISPPAMSKMSSGSSEPSTPNLWNSMSSLKRANPIYESDAEYEEADYSYSNSMRKRRCSIDRLTTAVYWQQELKSADE